jgi:general stress protein 26
MFYFGTDRRSRKALNIDSNPAVNVHLESGDDVVIIEGEASFIPPQNLPEKVADRYISKYGIQLKENPVFRVVPWKILAWNESTFPNSATRWIIGDSSR